MDMSIEFNKNLKNPVLTLTDRDALMVYQDYHILAQAEDLT